MIFPRRGLFFISFFSFLVVTLSCLKRSSLKKNGDCEPIFAAIYAYFFRLLFSPSRLLSSRGLSKGGHYRTTFPRNFLSFFQETQEYFPKYGN